MGEEAIGISGEEAAVQPSELTGLAGIAEKDNTHQQKQRSARTWRIHTGGCWGRGGAWCWVGTGVCLPTSHLTLVLEPSGIPCPKQSQLWKEPAADRQNLQTSYHSCQPVVVRFGRSDYPPRGQPRARQRACSSLGQGLPGPRLGRCQAHLCCHLHLRGASFPSSLCTSLSPGYHL